MCYLFFFCDDALFACDDVTGFCHSKLCLRYIPHGGNTNYVEDNNHLIVLEGDLPGKLIESQLPVCTLFEKTVHRCNPI